VPKYIKKADICLGIFGDTQKTQRVIPNKVYEAIAMKKPVITADTPAVRELFTDRKNILFCKTADPEDLAEKILELKNNEDIREKIAKGGYEIFKKYATPIVIGKKLKRDIYNLFFKNRYNKINRSRRNAIMQLISNKTGFVLDIGCGKELLGEAIKKEREVVVYGVDISSIATKEAEKKIDKAFCVDVEKDLEDWPSEIKSKKYDTVIISEILEYLLHPEKLLKNIKKLSHDKTEIIITVPNILFWKNRLKIFFGKFEYTNKGIMDRSHIHFFSWKNLKKLLNQSGYYIVAKEHFIPTRGTKWLGKIFPGLFAYQFVVKIKKKDIVIYTAIFGEKDKLIKPKFVPKNCDFICFTDSDFNSNVWKVKKVKPILKDAVRSARMYKILPHKFLSEYNYSIWIDGNMIVRGDVNELIKGYLSKYNLATYDHKQTSDSRGCIYEEAEALIEMAKRGKYKDDPNIIRKQIEKYKKEGYPSNNGLISSMVMLRRHNEPDVIKTMEDWWKEIKKYSRRDQLSFNYVAWKNKLNFVYLEGDSRDNKYFKHTLHQK